MEGLPLGMKNSFLPLLPNRSSAGSTIPYRSPIKEEMEWMETRRKQLPKCLRLLGNGSTLQVPDAKPRNIKDSSMQKVGSEPGLAKKGTSRECNALFPLFMCQDKRYLQLWDIQNTPGTKRGPSSHAIPA